MRLLTNPKQLPYPPRACVISGRVDGDVLDFQKAVDAMQPTHLYIRRQVIEDAAKLCGMVPQAEVAKLEERLEEFKKQFEELKGQMETYAEFEEKFGPKELMRA